MEPRTAIVTGANGEMGHLLLPALQAQGYALIAVDLQPVAPAIAACCDRTVVGSVVEPELMAGLFRDHRPDAVFHLAALLSSKAERDPDLAHDVNVSATLNLFRLCRERARQVGRDVRFLFPSSIAVYGLPDAAAKSAAGAVKEDEWNRPAGIYGCNKLYGEMIGSYFTTARAKTPHPGSISGRYDSRVSSAPTRSRRAERATTLRR
jgi:nucleoside-diphosphate-sugar epimerase